MKALLLAPSLLLLALAGAAQAQGVGRAAARTWDAEIVLPAGAYRASKPIKNGEHMKVRVQPGTVLDGIEFAGESDPKWTVEGAWLRKTRIIGALGTLMNAKDSVFDDCEMHRVGGWAVGYWGTRWRFENCVIGKRFLAGNLGVHDYSVRAVDCTFVGVTMPSIGFKDDPAKYYQRDELKFERCRFVQCEIPESLLAATIDCVFEGCQFSSKRADWSKAGSPIKVNATVVGGARAPAPYLNGPLSVNFVAGAGTGAGSTLSYSASAGRVTLNTIKAPGQFTMLGTVDKKASELPDTVVALATTTTPSAAPAPALPPSATPAAGEVRSLDEILRSLPAAVEPMPGGVVSPPAVETANVWLTQSFAGKPVVLRVKLEELQATKERGYIFQVVTREASYTHRGQTLPARVTALFRAEQAGSLSKIAKGADFTLRGVIDKAALQGRGRGLVLAVNVAEGQAQ